MDKISKISNALSEIKEQKMPIRLAYKLNKLEQWAESEYKFYIEHYRQIIEDFCERDENGNPKYSENGESILVQQGRQLECQEKLDELSMLEGSEPPKIEIGLDELDALDVSYSVVEALMPFIVEK